MCVEWFGFKMASEIGSIKSKKISVSKSFLCNIKRPLKFKQTAFAIRTPLIFQFWVLIRILFSPAGVDFIKSLKLVFERPINVGVYNFGV